MIGGGRPLIPEILSQSDCVLAKLGISLHFHISLARRRHHRLHFFAIIFFCYNCVIVFYLILILSFRFSAELISTPKFVESLFMHFIFFYFYTVSEIPVAWTKCQHLFHC